MERQEELKRERKGSRVKLAARKVGTTEGAVGAVVGIEGRCGNG